MCGGALDYAGKDIPTYLGLGLRHSTTALGSHSIGMGLAKLDILDSDPK